MHWLLSLTTRVKNSYSKAALKKIEVLHWPNKFQCSSLKNASKSKVSFFIIIIFTLWKDSSNIRFMKKEKNKSQEILEICSQSVSVEAVADFSFFALFLSEVVRLSFLLFFSFIMSRSSDSGSCVAWLSSVPNRK